MGVLSQVSPQLWTTILGGLFVLAGSVGAGILSYRASVTASKRSAAVESRRIDNEDFQVYTAALRVQIEDLRGELRTEQVENEGLLLERRKDHLAIRALERKVASLEDDNAEFITWLRAYQANLTETFKAHAKFDELLVAMLAEKGVRDLPEPPPIILPPPPLPERST